MNEENHRVKCPYCGYRMPIVAVTGAVSRGLYVKCKGRGCGKEFEIVLPHQNKK